MPFQYKRLPAVQKKIADINPEKDIRIRILGRVIDKSDGSFVIDDGSAKAEVVTETELNINDLVRIFVRVLPLEEGFELRSEIVQDMNSLDMNLYKKVWGDQ